jgi:mono/diheme cytochrome c family protein
MSVPIRVIAALVAGAAVCAGGVAAAQTADPSGGRKLAETFCSACHNVGHDAGAPSPNPDAPSFASVARTPALNDLAIRVFLRSPHASMPNFLLTEPEIDGVIAYIRTLGGT